jgi:hypothetical protein
MERVLSRERLASFRRSRRAALLFAFLVFPVLAAAQSQPPPAANQTNSNLPDAPHPEQDSGKGSPGTVSGQVMDRSGAAVVGAHIKLVRDDGSPSQEVLAGEQGQFSFVNVPPGSFHLAITATSFGAQTYTGELHPGEVDVIPTVQLEVATAVTEVHVAALSTVELAQVQLDEEMKQRVLGFMPNFYVTYNPHAAPLNSTQKFELAWKTTIDPVTFLFIGVAAGIGQAQNEPSGYGQGAAGYGRRFGAGLGDSLTNTFIGGAILPSLFKQDPRYFYKGTGSKTSRALYAIANAVICKGDNGRWQPGYSGILGAFASGAISTTYYPSKNRSAATVFENAGIGFGFNAAANLFQEFVVRKFTPNLPKFNPTSSGTP